MPKQPAIPGLRDAMKKKAQLDRTCIFGRPEEQ